MQYTCRLLLKKYRTN